MVVKKSGTSAKTFFILCVTGLVTYLLIAFYNFRKSYISIVEMHFQNKDENNLKYILIWNPINKTDSLIPEGQESFIVNNCVNQNCYVTSNKSILDYETDFDAIIFNSSLLRIWSRMEHPRYRTADQRYVFYGKTPPTVPICDDAINDEYFNITWSYKLNSDIVSPFIEVVDDRGLIIAPRSNVKWHDGDISVYLDAVKTKNKPIITVINDCSRFKNKSFIKKLKYALKRYSIDFEIYGCKQKCPEKGCNELIRNEYFFYLVYDNYFAEDYVTQEVLKAYDNNAIPVLIGGANYSNFLPKGSYINAKEYTVRKLSAILNHIIKNPEIYLSYFRWSSHYTIQEVEPLRGICQLCSILNSNKKPISKASGRFREWWFPKKFNDQCIFQNQNFSTF